MNEYRVETPARTMKVFFFLMITLLSLQSCKNPSSTAKSFFYLPHYFIDLDKSIENIKAIPLSSIGKEISYIPLETNPVCLIERINKISISDSFIFVSDGTKLIQFTRNGNFVRQIGSNGRGPGEYTYIWDFCVNKEARLIYTLNAGSRGVLVFNFNGNFIKSFLLPTQQTQIIMIDTNSLMFHVPNMIIRSDDTTYSWLITDEDGRILSRHINHLKRVNFPGFTVPMAPALYKFNRSVHFMEYGIDSLFYFNKEKIEPYATFNLGQLKMDPDPLLKSEEDEEKYSRNIWIYSVIEDLNNLYINLNWGISISPVSYVFNKQTSEATFLEDKGFLNDLDFGITFWPREILNDSILIDYIDAFQLKAHTASEVFKNSIPKYNKKKKELEKLANSLKETDNPVLMIVRLKK